MILLDGARETLVLLGIVVLEADLKLNRLQELAFLVLGLGENGVNTIVQHITRNLRPEIN